MYFKSMMVAPLGRRVSTGCFFLFVFFRLVLSMITFVFFVFAFHMFSAMDLVFFVFFPFVCLVFFVCFVCFFLLFLFLASRLKAQRTAASTLEVTDDWRGNAVKTGVIINWRRSMAPSMVSLKYPRKTSMITDLEFVPLQFVDSVDACHSGNDPWRSLSLAAQCTVFLDASSSNRLDKYHEYRATCTRVFTFTTLASCHDTRRSRQQFSKQESGSFYMTRTLLQFSGKSGFLLRFEDLLSSTNTPFATCSTNGCSCTAIGPESPGVKVLLLWYDAVRDFAVVIQQEQEALCRHFLLQHLVDLHGNAGHCIQHLVVAALHVT